LESQSSWHQIQQFLDAGADAGFVLANRARLHPQAERDIFKHRMWRNSA